MCAEEEEEEGESPVENLVSGWEERGKEERRLWVSARRVDMVAGDTAFGIMR